jgi:hypothetical protein
MHLKYRENMKELVMETRLRFKQWPTMLQKLLTPTRFIIEGIVFWDITPCSPLKVNQRFGETYRLHLQG